MNFEQKYNKLVDAIKVLQEANPSDEGIQSWVHDNVPELVESEDEGIRKTLIELVRCNERSGYFSFNNIETSSIIAWLEKQGDKKQVEHLELKAGHWYICHRPYCCRADSLTVKEGERFKCEKDGVVKGFVIKEPEKYFREISVPAFMEDELNDEVRRISTIQVLEYAKSLDAYNQYGKEDISKNIAWLEKQGEQQTNLPKWRCKRDDTPLLSDSLVLNKYGCVLKAPSGAIISDAWVLDYEELAKLPKEEPEEQDEQKIGSKPHCSNEILNTEKKQEDALNAHCEIISKC